MIGVVVAYLGGHFLYACIVSAFQYLLRMFQSDVDQIVYRRIPRFALEDLGNVKGAQIHVFCNLI